MDDPRNLGESITRGMPGVGSGLDAMQSFGQNVVDPAQAKLMQILQMLGMMQQAPQAGLVNDPIGGGPMSRRPLQQSMTGGRLPGSIGQDPSMGMGY